MKLPPIGVSIESFYALEVMVNFRLFGSLLHALDAVAAGDGPAGGAWSESAVGKASTRRSAPKKDSDHAPLLRALHITTLGHATTSPEANDA